MKYIFRSLLFVTTLLFLSTNAKGQDVADVKKSNPQSAEKVKSSRIEVVTPLHKDSFNKNGECPERKQG